MQQGQRKTDLIVVIPYGPQRVIALAQHRGGHLFASCLAYATGNPDHTYIVLTSPVSCDPLQRLQALGHQEAHGEPTARIHCSSTTKVYDGRIDPRQRGLFRENGHGPLFDGSRCKVVSIVVFSLKGHEQAARRCQPRVDYSAFNAR
jgi:hypothetical protein